MSEAKNRARRGATTRLPESEAGPQRTERLEAGDAEWSAQEPVNPGWRRERSATRPPRRRAGALPSSPQEFQLWLQAGGWHYVAGIAVLLVVLLIAMLSFARSDQREAGLGFEEPTAVAIGGVGSDAGVLSPLPEATSALPPTAEPAPPVAQAFVVAGTGAEGLFLRPEPNTNGAPLATIPEGSRVEQIGEDFAGPDRVWRNVRAPDGNEGWVAVDFLQPAP
jgi:hypothetical protein